MCIDKSSLLFRLKVDQAFRGPFAHCAANVPPLIERKANIGKDRRRTGGKTATAKSRLEPQAVSQTVF